MIHERHKPIAASFPCLIERFFFMSNHYPMKPRFEKIGIYAKWVRIADHAFPQQFVGRRFVVVNPAKVGLDKFLFID